MSQITSFSTGGGAGAVLTLTGNSGGAVPPTAGNINVVGDTTTINVAGNPGTSTLTISATGTTIFNYTDVNTSPYVAIGTDNFISVDSTGGPITIELPNAPATGRAFRIKDRAGTAAANNITITTVGGVVLIDGATTFVMNTAFESVSLLFGSGVYQAF